MYADTDELTPREAGKVLNLRGERVKQLIAQGELLCRRIDGRGGLHLIRYRDVIALDKRRKEQTLKRNSKRSK